MIKIVETANIINEMTFFPLYDMYDGASVNSRNKNLNLFSPPFF